MKKYKKTKRDKNMPILAPDIDISSINSFRKYRRQYKNQKQHFVSVSMEVPVFSQYTYLNQKKNSRYNRISRTITQNKNFKPALTEINNISKAKTLFRSSTSQQKPKQEKWNQQIKKYMSIKQELSGFKSTEHKFPLMKLNRCNQIKRKIMFGSNLSEDKPSFIYELETQDPQQLSLSKNNTPALSASKSVKFNVKKVKPFNRQKHEVKKNSNQTQADNDYEEAYILQNLPKAANQNEKILINFISQYFKQKLKSSRKKRFNYERTWSQITNPIHLNINQFKNHLDQR